jgi:hypothetical protein
MIKEAETMAQDADWASYQGARRAALRGCASTQAASTSIGRAKGRLRTYFGLEPEEAHVQARRCLLFNGDAAFHDQFLASGPTGLLRTLMEKTGADRPPLQCNRSRGAVLVSLHYGPATSILPLWFAMGMVSASLIIRLGLAATRSYCLPPCAWAIRACSLSAVNQHRSPRGISPYNVDTSGELGVGRGSRSAPIGTPPQR